MPPKFSRPTIRKTIYSKSVNNQTRTSPCEAACPAGNPIQKIHSLIEEGKRTKALEYLQARNPLAGVTGRICNYPCESVCNRGSYDEAVSIRQLERFAADCADNSPLKIPQKKSPSGKKVAVIGAGPAGLTCAYFSALLGHEVVIFEAAPVLGGIPRLLAPDYKLPKDIVDRHVGRILSMGITARTNVHVGKDIAFATIRENFDACLISVGTVRDRKPDFPGAELALPALSFLKKVNLGQEVTIGDRVVILGGGGVAFDCAFTARRLGASEVSIVCVEGEECMCVGPEDIQQARAEIIRVLSSSLACEIQHDHGELKGVNYFKVADFSFDQRCRLSVERCSEQTHFLPADSVISAIGVQSDFSFLEHTDDLTFTSKGTLSADNGTMSTSINGVFAAGDAASGPSSVAAAIGSGRQVAIAIHRYLCGERENKDVVVDSSGQVVERDQGKLEEPHIVEFTEILNIWHHPKGKRQQAGGALVDNYMRLRSELVKGLGEAKAKIEAGRCLHCGHCTSCGTCVEDCPGMILEMTDCGPAVAYPEECWHCGCCRIACPSSAVSYEFPLHMLV